MATQRHLKAKPISGPWVVEQEMERIAGIAIHPAAQLFERMPDAQIEELAADIKQRGLKQPLLFLRGHDGYSLLDGRNRLCAHTLLGDVKLTSEGLPQISHKVVQTDDPIAFVLSHNLHRRHLTNEERAKLVRRIATEHPEYSVRRLAEVTGASKSAAHRAVQEEPVKPPVEEEMEPPLAGKPGAEESADEASGVPAGTGVPQLKPEPAPRPNPEPAPQPKPEPAPQPKPESKRVIGKDGKSYSKKQPAKSKPTTGQKPAANTRDQAVVAICAQLAKKPRETIEDFIKLMDDARRPTLKLPESARFHIVMNFAAALGFGAADLLLHLQTKPMPQDSAA
jgi:ParB-like nuclease domain